MTAWTRRGWVPCALAVVTTACQGPPAETPAADPAPIVSVTVAPVVRRTMHAYVEGWGRVEPAPAGDGRPAANARIASPVPGLIAAVLGSEGQRVAQGDLVVQLDGRVAGLAIERAKQAVGIAEQLVKRQEALGPGQATSQRAYDDAVAQLTMAQSELTATELQRQLLGVRAPIAGTLVAIVARVGTAIDPTTVLAEIVDLERLVVSASVRGVDVAKVRRGQAMAFWPGAGPDTPAQAPPDATTGGPVVFIGSQIDGATDTVVVRARVPAQAGLRPGQFVAVRILVEERADRLAVPVESLVQGEAGSEIAIVRGTTATRTPVTTGLREGGLVEVAGDGVQDGASVVVQGAYGLPGTSAIKVMGR
ncbi:MAG: efflux RND transporter periplasmic adaptor subunit [Acidobacteriota bacterium]